MKKAGLWFSLVSSIGLVIGAGVGAFGGPPGIVIGAAVGAVVGYIASQDCEKEFEAIREEGLAACDRLYEYCRRKVIVPYLERRGLHAIPAVMLI